MSLAKLSKSLSAIFILYWIKPKPTSFDWYYSEYWHWGKGGLTLYMFLVFHTAGLACFTNWRNYLGALVVLITVPPIGIFTAYRGKFPVGELMGKDDAVNVRQGGG